MDYTEWFNDSNVRPFIFVRKGNLPSKPGSVHQFKFPHGPISYDPLILASSKFAAQILTLENQCFKSSGMILPRWAFYDCSIMPGMVVGFAYKQSALPEKIRKVLSVDTSLEYIPISLFICIPTNESKHWVAHNLCSVNHILPHEERFSCLGFLTKAFGLWYFNVEYLYGMTQWGSPSVKVHTNYGVFEIISAYNEIHDYKETLTYRVDVQADYWNDFLEDKITGPSGLKATSMVISPKNQAAMRNLQHRLEKGEGPYFLNGKDFLSDNREDLTIYTRV